MSWSSTARRVRDVDRPMGQRVNALHSLVARHHTSLGFTATRRALRSLVGVTGRRWREEEVMRALEHLEATRSLRLAVVWEVAARRRTEKAAGRRWPTSADLALLGTVDLSSAPDIDLGTVLRRVVDDVLGPDVGRVFWPRTDHTYRVQLTSPDGRRHAGLEVSPSGWFGVWVLDDLDVSAFHIEYDQVEHYQADAVRRVALVAGAYLAGDFTVRRRRTWFRRRLQPVVEVEVRGERWTLRRAALTR